MEINLTEIVIAIIGLLFALLTTKLYPLAKESMSASQYEMLMLTTRVLVYAAEQLYGPGGGGEKMAYVVAALKEKGLTVDLNLIESFVRELKIDQAGMGGPLISAEG